MSKVDWFSVFVPAFTQSLTPSCIKKVLRTQASIQLILMSKNCKYWIPALSLIDTVSVQCWKNVITVYFSSCSGSCSDQDISSEINVCVGDKQDFFVSSNI